MAIYSDWMASKHPSVGGRHTQPEGHPWLTSAPCLTNVGPQPWTTEAWTLIQMLILKRHSQPFSKAELETMFSNLGTPAGREIPLTNTTTRWKAQIFQFKWPGGGGSGIFTNFPRGEPLHWNSPRGILQTFHMSPPADMTALSLLRVTRLLYFKPVVVKLNHREGLLHTDRWILSPKYPAGLVCRRLIICFRLVPWGWGLDA